MAMFMSEKNIIDAVVREIEPKTAEIEKQVTELCVVINAMSNNVEAIASEFQKVQASLAIKNMEIENDASQKAAEIVSGLGLDPVEDVPESEPAMSLLEQFNNLTGAAQREFYEKNRAEILKQIN